MPTYQADEEILTGTLYRRVPPLHNYYPRGPNGQPSSSAFLKNFKKGHKGTSAYLADETIPDQIDQIMQHPHGGWGLVAISVEKVRESGFTVEYAPRLGPPHHVLICGDYSQNAWKRRCHDLSLACTPVRTPPGLTETLQGGDAD